LDGKPPGYLIVGAGKRRRRRRSQTTSVALTKSNPKALLFAIYFLYRIYISIAHKII
jgi:hypothetical protein